MEERVSILARIVWVLAGWVFDECNGIGLGIQPTIDDNEDVPRREDESYFTTNSTVD